MNFKKMAEEATARKEEETPNLDFEDMTDLRDDAISDFEMSFDREAELREENERRVAEQANLSHSQDHYIANKGAYDAVGATAPAGIQEDEEPPSSSRSILKNFLKSSKPVIKAVATAVKHQFSNTSRGIVQDFLYRSVPISVVPFHTHHLQYYFR